MYENYVAEELVAPETEPAKDTHAVKVVRISEILPHNNADSLEIILIGGYQCVVRKESFKVGDYGVYIQPDSIVPKTEPFRFIWEGYQTEPDGDVPVRRRRITVRKFRKEWSEGLLLPLSDFPEYFTKHGLVDGSTDYNYAENGQPVDAGDDVAEMLGITHYEPEDKGTGGYQYAPRKKRRLPKTFRGWVNYIFRFRWLWAVSRRLRGESTEVGVNAPRYDVNAYKNHTDAFINGEMVDITEKVHGSNARYMWLDGHMYAGSHNLWKAPDSKCIWRRVLEVQPWIVEWCKANEGYTLYGEVTPTQAGFNYGSDEPQLFAFDIYTPEGKWVKPWNNEDATNWRSLGIKKTVPWMTRMPFDIDVIKANYVDGDTDTLGNHIREGVVISACDPERTAHGVGRLQLKIVSNAYYEKS